MQRVNRITRLKQARDIQTDTFFWYFLRQSFPIYDISDQILTGTKIRENITSIFPAYTLIFIAIAG
jgi:hypothetical protein